MPGPPAVVRRVRGGRVGPAPSGGITEILARQAERDPRKALQRVQDSARGWHTAQIAVLGLLGVVGVTRSEDSIAALPDPVRIAITVLVLMAFLAASVGALLIARVAWPLWQYQPVATEGDERLLHSSVRLAQRRLRRAVAATTAALLPMGLAFLLSWWPVSDEPAGNQVRVRSTSGTLCGSLGTSSGTAVSIDVGGQAVIVPAGDIVTIEPVPKCS